MQFNWSQGVVTPLHKKHAGDIAAYRGFILPGIDSLGWPFGGLNKAFPYSVHPSDIQGALFFPLETSGI